MPTIIASVIGAIATIIAALITALVGKKLDSFLFRKRYGIPDIRGEWQCEWFRGEKLYVSDRVKVEKWTTKGRFKGLGDTIQPNYTIDGQVDATRVVTLIYRAENYPQSAYIGSAVLEIDMDAKNLRGQWFGRLKDGTIDGGQVAWRKT